MKIKINNNNHIIKLYKFNEDIVKLNKYLKYYET